MEKYQPHCKTIIESSKDENYIREVEETQKTKIKNEDFEITEIKNTPFAILNDKKNNEIWLIIGNEKIYKCKSEQEATKTAQLYKWDLLGPTIYTIAVYALNTILSNKKEEKTYNL